MSWHSDREPFDEYEGCGHCQFKNKKSPYTCGECEWNDEDFGDDPCAECEGEGCENCYYAQNCNLEDDDTPCRDCEAEKGEEE